MDKGAEKPEFIESVKPGTGELMPTFADKTQREKLYKEAEAALSKAKSTKAGEQLASLLDRSRKLEDDETKTDLERKRLADNLQITLKEVVKGPRETVMEYIKPLMDVQKRASLDKWETRSKVRTDAENLAKTIEDPAKKTSLLDAINISKMSEIDQVQSDQDRKMHAEAVMNMMDQLEPKFSLKTKVKPQERKAMAALEKSLDVKTFEQKFAEYSAKRQRMLDMNKRTLSSPDPMLRDMAFQYKNQIESTLDPEVLKTSNKSDAEKMAMLDKEMNKLRGVEQSGRQLDLDKSAVAKWMEARQDEDQKMAKNKEKSPPKQAAAEKMGAEKGKLDSRK